MVLHERVVRGEKMTKCWVCKAKAWCFDDDGKTPYCSSCWEEKNTSSVNKESLDGS